MSLEQVYYIGSLIGVVAVIGSLLFVARQIRLNTHQMRVNASAEWVELQMNLLNGFVENRDVAAIWVKSGTDADFEALDEVDRQRAVIFEFRAIAAWSHLFQLRQQGLLPDPQWKELNWIVATIGKRRATREAWQFFGESYDRSFRDFIESRLADQAG